MFSEAEINLIKNIYNNDKDAFLEAHAKGRSQTKKWQDIVATAKVLPELEMTARELIAGLLGYLPPDHILIVYEPSLRALMQQYRMGDFNFIINIFITCPNMQNRQRTVSRCSWAMSLNSNIPWS